jgi:serine/threonine protein kinase/class 3 adenylate cyclase
MLGGYVLLNQLGAGRDGTRYRAFDPRSKCTVDLRVLNELETSELDSRRARRLRAAAMLTHQTAIHLLELAIDRTPPFVVVQLVATPNVSETDGALAPLSIDEAVTRAADLAEGMADAHRLGLARARFSPDILARDDPRDRKMDWTGLDVGSHSEGGADLERANVLSAPEDAGMEALARPEADVYALGATLLWQIAGRRPDRTRTMTSRLSDAPALETLVTEMLSAEPLDRPSAAEVVKRLRALSGLHEPDARNLTRNGPATYTAFVDLGAASIEVGGLSSLINRDRLGRFLIREKLGEGGMGAVYRAEDMTDGSNVAIKVLRDQLVRRPDSLKRFHKEARMLAEANNAHVTNLIEVNEDDGIHFIALEYVRGRSLSWLIGERERLDEQSALAIMADVARGLAAAHERGIIHRDVKPDNILLLEDGSDGRIGAERGARPAAKSMPVGAGPRVKLSDFGLARHVAESESLNLTQTGAILGTPLYMAPEQGLGTGEVGPAADVYAMGATLFHMLAGQPPFSGGSALSLISMHKNDPPPSLHDLNINASEGVSQVVAKALAKRPEERYRDAGELLADLERLLRGEPTGIQVHPRLPACDPRQLVRFDFRWELDASPRQLWPHVSNTERVNRALGLPAVPFKAEFDPNEGVKRFGELKTAGVAVHWREFPYEWVEGRRMGVLRDFDAGPFRWFVSIVELTPRAGGGTTLTHSVRIAVNGLVGRAIAALKIGKNGRKSMDRVYRRIDAAITGKLGQAADPFEPAVNLPRERVRRLENWAAGLEARAIDPLVGERLAEFIAQAAPQDVARIRPLALARRLGLDPDQVVAACLFGASEGILVLLWDLLCPVCRIPSEVIGTLRALREHAHCEACHVDFDLDFANSVELIFRAHPEIRDSELGTYCIGGPAHSPHVVAQVRVGPGERIALDLALGEGTYRLRGPQLPYAIDFRVESTAAVRRWDVDLAAGPPPDLPRALKPDGQALALANSTAYELVVRVERTAPRDDALTAARASALALFRDLFPDEILSAGQLINLATVTLLVTELDHSGDIYHELGDARAFGVVHEHFRIVDACIRRHGGALVKTINEGVVAVFSETLPAVKAVMELAPALARGELTRELGLRAGVHRGPALVATLNDHLDYFGTTVRVATQLLRLADAGGEAIFSPAVASDPAVASFFKEHALAASIVDAEIPGLAERFAHRVDMRSLREQRVEAEVVERATQTSPASRSRAPR